jgi:hypothetical protein
MKIRQINELRRRSDQTVEARSVRNVGAFIAAPHVEATPVGYGHVVPIVVPLTDETGRRPESRSVG